LDTLFKGKYENILNVYFTAGHPKLNDTATIISILDSQGVDLVEVGIPYSDPMADGETIQNSSSKALKNGMNLLLLFNQIKEARRTSQIPIVLMGYFNQMLQFGPIRFIEQCVESGVDGLIIPDLPMDIYERDYQPIFEANQLKMTFLITPETSDERIVQADRLSSGFVYVVSKSSITGTSSELSEDQMNYFKRIDRLNLNSPRLIGFGIHDKTTYDLACQHSQGAIIGSAFIRSLEHNENLSDTIEKFITSIR
jgi:tryptophan synthase alpha chain